MPTTAGAEPPVMPELSFAMVRRAHRAWRATQNPRCVEQDISELQGATAELSAWVTGAAHGPSRPSALKARRDALIDGYGRLYLAMEALALTYQIDLEEAIAERFNDRARNAPRSPGAHGE